MTFVNILSLYVDETFYERPDLRTILEPVILTFDETVINSVTHVWHFSNRTILI